MISYIDLRPLQKTLLESFQSYNEESLYKKLAILMLSNIMYVLDEIPRACGLH